jgi:hypothetical protein
LAAPATRASQPSQQAEPASSQKKETKTSKFLAEEGPVATDWAAQLESLRHAAQRLPLAAALSAILAFRPRRRGTPPRQPAVIQTQIILAIVGAMVMLVVGVSVARAFGIVGAAGLIRYRARIEDPKDAGVMLSTLGLGLASGVGMYVLACFAAVFVLGVLWLIESIEPESYAIFDLTVASKDPAALKDRIEAALRRNRVKFELRSTSPEEICYEVKLPLDRHTDRVSEALMQLDPSGSTNVKWEEKKVKKN